MRSAYVIGVLDGFYFSPVFGAPFTKIDKLQICADAMNPTAEQAAAIVDRYLDAHPEAWNDQMQPIVLRAMRQACASRGTPID